MIQYIIRMSKEGRWWRVRHIRDGAVTLYSFVFPLIFSWLRDVLKGRGR